MQNPITSISPLDGRYSEKLKNLEPYFSEYGLIRYRVFVEIEWFIFLCNEVKLSGTRELNTDELKILHAVSTDFELADALRVKEFETRTNHDVKAVEYYIKEHFTAYPRIAALAEFIHFGATSEDINNISYGLLMKDFGAKEFMPIISGVISALHNAAKKYAGISMLAHTHGQPASPTTAGKEFINVVARLERQFAVLKTIPRTAKWNGATGNFNALEAAYPEIDWPGVSVRFITYLGLTPNQYTTQIEPHDTLAERFDAIARINTILIDFCRDIWTYISLGYFKQKVKKGETGSSTMPHKVNPIDFENAEGNLGLANALLRHMAEKLPVSRMQRDLTDSTVMRNIGAAVGHCVLAYKSLLNGLQKLELNKARLKKDLDENWEVLTEAIQTVLRKYKVPGAYEKLKNLSRGKRLAENDIKAFVKDLKIGASDKKRLLALTPATYTGAAKKLTDSYKLSL